MRMAEAPALDLDPDLALSGEITIKSRIMSRSC
jgi:hypothetical protein